MNDRIPEIKPFQAFVYNSIPTLFDNSLSYYELLSKFLGYLNILIESANSQGQQIEEITRLYNELSDFLNNYLNSPEFREDLSNKLDEMALDGTLARIINEVIFKGLNDRVNELEKNQVFVPTGDEHEDYKNDTLSVIASWFVSDRFNSCVVGTPTLPYQRVLLKYEMGKTFMGLLGEDNGIFEYDETQVVNGETFNIAYFDCATWLAIVTKCRSYLKSPYYRAINYGTIPEQGTKEYEDFLKDLRGYALEDGTTKTKPYTFDFMNYTLASNEAYIMSKSGNTVRKLSENNPIMGTEAVFNEDVLKGLETGDMIFEGNSTDEDYLGISHCGYYLKSLDELNVFGEMYGVTFTYLPHPTSANDNPKYGYFVSFRNSSSSSNDYTNCLRIDTIDFTANIKPSGANWHRLYTCKPYSNALNSNKARRELNMGFTYFNRTYDSRRVDYNGDVVGSIERIENNLVKRKIVVDGIDIQGEYLSPNADLNKLDNGVYIRGSASTDIINVPSTITTERYTLFQYGKKAGIYGVQILYPNTTTNKNLYVRGQTYTGVWGEWREI